VELRRYSGREELADEKFPQLSTKVCRQRQHKSLTKIHCAHTVRKSFLINRALGAYAMKNVYEVLRQKELELSRLEKEVEALRVAAPLLSDDKESGGDMDHNKPTLTGTVVTQQPIRIPQSAVAGAAPQPARAAGWEDSAKRWP
jgi:hypothetical protein